jgi:hypothetical protein
MATLCDNEVMSAPVNTAARLSIPDAVAAERGAPSPTGADIRKMLDLRADIDDYLIHAVDLWFERACEDGVITDYCPGEEARVVGYNAYGVTIAYYYDNRDRLEFRDTRHVIPIAELLPEFAAHQNLLDTLAGRPS